MRSRSIRRWLVSIVCALIAVECSAALICWLMSTTPLTGRLLWRPDLELARNNWNAHLSVTDEAIGGLAASGLKPNSEFSDGAQPCGSAYGDSFVGGAEVPNDEGWVEQLSHALGCRVNNYAVGGYGPDQAFLRFQQGLDDSPMVLLGLDPNGIMDVVLQYDGFVTGELEPFSLKGRFLLEPSGRLKWLPPPRLDANGFVAMHRNPEHVLPHSYFLPDTRDGPVTFRFPYAVTLARVALMPRLHDALLRRSEWSSLYHPDHPSGALQLMIAISEAFVELAKARGKHALIVMLPVAGSFREQANHGEFEYAPLVAALRTKHIQVFDPGNAIIAALEGRSPCELFTHQQAGMAWLASPLPCGRHYSSLANTILARLVGAEIRRLNFLRQ